MASFGDGKQCSHGQVTDEHMIVTGDSGGFGQDIEPGTEVTLNWTYTWEQGEGWNITMPDGNTWDVGCQDLEPVWVPPTDEEVNAAIASIRGEG